MSPSTFSNKICAGLPTLMVVIIYADIALSTYITMEKMKQLRSLESQLTEADRRFRAVTANFNERKNVPGSKPQGVRVLQVPISGGKHEPIIETEFEGARHGPERRAWIEDMEKEIIRTWDARHPVMQEIAFRRGELSVHESYLPDPIYRFLEKRYLTNG